MKIIFLTSSAQKVMQDVITRFPDGHGIKTAFIATAAEGEDGGVWILKNCISIVG